MEAVTGQPIKKFNFFEFSRVSTGAHTLTKKPQDSGYEIGLWGTGILLPQDFCDKTVEVVAGQPIKKFNFFEFPRVSTGAHPLTKKPEDSGYEIGVTQD